MNHYLAIDQYGCHHSASGASPRIAFLDHFGRRSARIIYNDLRSGATIQTGYIIAGLWLSPIFTLERWEKKVS